MNHNLLSVGKMCDQGHTILFNSTKCEIRKCRYGKILATASRAPNDIYVLDEATKACLLAKEDESWLCHKQMGHINFDNLVRISKKEAVREMLKKFKMEDCKPILTPMVTSCKLSIDDSSKDVDQKLYRSMIGSLLYVTASQIDVMQAVVLEILSLMEKGYGKGIVI